jgi:hypothetical protein
MMLRWGLVLVLMLLPHGRLIHHVVLIPSLRHPISRRSCRGDQEGSTREGRESYPYSPYCPCCPYRGRLGGGLGDIVVATWLVVHHLYLDELKSIFLAIQCRVMRRLHNELHQQMHIPQYRNPWIVLQVLA